MNNDCMNGYKVSIVVIVQTHVALLFSINIFVGPLP